MSGRFFFCFTLAAVLLAAAAGCQNPVTQPQPVSRADLGTQPLQQTTTTPPPPAVAAQVVGSYTFTIPPTVTEFEKTQGPMQQYLLYNGKPTPDQTPFLTITVAPDIDQATAKDPNFHIQNQRTYMLNDLAAQEWTGYTADQAPFTELIITNPSGGEKLDALAVAPDEPTRQLALNILESIRWQPAPNAPSNP
jgi:hypothetical protein